MEIVGHRLPMIAAVLVAGIGLSAATVGGCALTGRATVVSAADASERYAGFTKSVLTPTYLIVINVLPPEEMFTPAEVDARHPVEGEMALRGPSGPIVASSRHVEAHIYSRLTGRPLSEVTPSITLTDHVTGAVTQLEPTLMQDIIIGSADQHFGNNVVIESHHDFTIHVGIDDERASVAGRLD